VSRPARRAEDSLAPARHAARRVVMVTCPGDESTLVDVVFNLATVCAEVGQQVVIIGTKGLSAPPDGSELPQAPSLQSKDWSSSWADGMLPAHEMRDRLQTGPVDPSDVKAHLGETGVPGVSRLDLRSFVGHPARVVMRAPEVLAALQTFVDVVIFEVPSFVSVHHGEGLAPLADVVLVVGERRNTKLNEIRKTREALTRLGAPVVGMALTRAPEGTYVWGHYSEYDEALDPELDETIDHDHLQDHDTAQLPLVKVSDGDAAAPHDEAVVDLATPDA
jgi:hypothetical protein